MSEPARWPGPEYHVQTTFNAPLRYAFRWCTDFTPNDAKLEREKYERRIIRRTPRQVLFEDLESSPSGWSWIRFTVTLQPPDRWHMEGTGSHVQIRADYRLSELPGDRTRFDLWWRRRPGLLEFTKRAKRMAEQNGTRAWQRFARVLNRDYRASRH